MNGRGSASIRPGAAQKRRLRQEEAKGALSIANLSPLKKLATVTQSAASVMRKKNA